MLRTHSSLKTFGAPRKKQQYCSFREAIATLQFQIPKILNAAFFILIFHYLPKLHVQKLFILEIISALRKKQS